MKKMNKWVGVIGLMFAALLALSALSACSDDGASDSPGSGVTVKPARATWSTGYFNEALYSRALEQLGYTVEDYQELDNPLFYTNVGNGEVTYWANGWFPIHDQYRDKFEPGATVAGTVIKGGALQGYLIDKKGAEKFGITKLSDFKTNADARAAYDADGNGKADLVGCPDGWGCKNVIAHHLDDLGLRDAIDEGTAGYSPAMADLIARYNNGKHVLFYTWTPNWTVSKLVPGKDVVWIGLPKGSHLTITDAAQLTASGVEGAATDPIIFGFAASDIQVVANQKFLDDNPSAAKLFEVMRFSLGDVADQNGKMNAGEDSDVDLERHVDEWIAANQSTWDGWISDAKAAG